MAGGPNGDGKEAHFNAVISALKRGNVVPFLGAGVNLAGRPQKYEWDPKKKEYLPKADELAIYLAKNFGYLPGETTKDLANVSQYVDLTSGRKPLYEELHGLFNVDYPVPSPHAVLAQIPKWMRERGYPLSSAPLKQRFVILTTNYDDFMERAFDNAGEAYHVLTYLADPEDEAERGRFLHTAPGGGCQIVKVPNAYGGLADAKPVIVKLHGAVYRQSESPERDSYVITEDHYIEYLAGPDITSVLPVPVPAKLQNSSFLFLGYSLRDWNLRVILHRLWGRRRLSYTSWSVNIRHDDLEKKFWGDRRVDIFLTDIGDYINEMKDRLWAVPQVAGGGGG